MKRSILIVLSICFTYGLVAAQATSTVSVDKRKIYPHFSVSPIGGALFPVTRNLRDEFKPGGMFGLDLGVRINREVGIYGLGAYYFMSSRVTGAPLGSYLEVSAGPRYYFTHPRLKSSVFLEGGVGAYNFRQASYNTAEGNLSRVIPQINNTRAGMYGGIGGSLALSKYVDILVKGKYNSIFTPNGTVGFVSVIGGLEVTFR